MTLPGRRRPRGRVWRAGVVVVALLCGGSAAVLAADHVRTARATLAFAQSVEAARARARLLERRGEREAAASVLAEVAASPGAEFARPAVRIPLQSALLGDWARLRLDLAAEAGDGAGPAVEEVIARLAARVSEIPDEQEDDAFTARLYALLGEAYERKGRDDEALEAYGHALEINRRLLRRLVEDDAGVP